MSWMFEYDENKRFAFVYKEDPENIRLRTNHIKAHIDKTLASYAIPNYQSMTIYFGDESNPEAINNAITKMKVLLPTGGLVLLQHDYSFIILFLKAVRADLTIDQTKYVIIVGLF